MADLALAEFFEKRIKRHIENIKTQDSMTGIHLYQDAAFEAISIAADLYVITPDEYRAQMIAVSAASRERLQEIHSIREVPA